MLGLIIYVTQQLYLELHSVLELYPITPFCLPEKNCIGRLPKLATNLGLIARIYLPNHSQFSTLSKVSLVPFWGIHETVLQTLTDSLSIPLSSKIFQICLKLSLTKGLPSLSSCQLGFSPTIIKSTWPILIGTGAVQVLRKLHLLQVLFSDFKGLILPSTACTIFKPVSGN